MIYAWKFLEGLAQNFGIEISTSLCTVLNAPAIPATMRAMYCNNLGFKGPQLFNTLLKYIRIIHGVGIDVFKNQLDLPLSKIPDELTSRSLKEDSNTKFPPSLKDNHIQMATEKVITQTVPQHGHILLLETHKRMKVYFHIHLYMNIYVFTLTQPHTLSLFL